MAINRIKQVRNGANRSADESIHQSYLTGSKTVTSQNHTWRRIILDDGQIGVQYFSNIWELSTRKNFFIAGNVFSCNALKVGNVLQQNLETLQNLETVENLAIVENVQNFGKINRKIKEENSGKGRRREREADWEVGRAKNDRQGQTFWKLAHAKSGSGKYFQNLPRQKFARRKMWQAKSGSGTAYPPDFPLWWIVTLSGWEESGEWNYKTCKVKKGSFPSRTFPGLEPVKNGIF